MTTFENWRRGFLDGLSLSAVALRRAHTELQDSVAPPDVPTLEWDMMIRGFGAALECVENLEMHAEFKDEPGPPQ